MKKEGFTLLEFLIYTALLSLTVFAIGEVAFHLLKAKPKAEAILEVNYNGRFALERIKDYLKESKNFQIDEGGKILSLSGFEIEDKNPTLFQVFDKILMVKEGDKDWVPLTTPKVRVDFLNFEKIDLTLKIEMRISFQNPQNLPELDFSNFFRTAFPLEG